MAVNYQGQGCPAISSSPDSAKVSGPAFIRRRRHRGHGLHSRPKADGALSNLLATDLEDPLYGVFVKPQKVSHRSIPKRRLLLDHRLDRRLKPLLNLGRCLSRPVIDSPPRNLKPPAELRHRHLDSIFFQFLFDGCDYLSSPPNREFNFFRAPSSSMASPCASCSSLSCRSYCL